MIRDPITHRVVDGIARCAPQAEQLGLGLAPIADGCEVLIAPHVDLAGAHDDVTLARPHDVEDGAIGRIALDDLLARRHSDRNRVGHQRGDRVGHHQVGFERGARQTSADDRHGADRVAQDLAVAAKGFGHGNAADFVDHHITHRCPRALMAST